MPIRNYLLCTVIVVLALTIGTQAQQDTPLDTIKIDTNPVVIIVGGRSGTLGEFAIAYEEGKLIGVLTNTGGITTALPALQKSIGKKTGSEVIYALEPEELVKRLLDRYLSGNYVCPCHPGSVKTLAAAKSC